MTSGTKPMANETGKNVREGDRPRNMRVSEAGQRHSNVEIAREQQQVYCPESALVKMEEANRQISLEAGDGRGQYKPHVFFPKRSYPHWSLLTVLLFAAVLACLCVVHLRGEMEEHMERWMRLRVENMINEKVETLVERKIISMMPVKMVTSRTDGMTNAKTSRFTYTNMEDMLDPIKLDQIIETKINRMMDVKINELIDMKTESEIKEEMEMLVEQLPGIVREVVAENKMSRSPDSDVAMEEVDVDDVSDTSADDAWGQLQWSNTTDHGVTQTKVTPQAVGIGRQESTWVPLSRPRRQVRPPRQHQRRHGRRRRRRRLRRTESTTSHPHSAAMHVKGIEQDFIFDNVNGAHYFTWGQPVNQRGVSQLVRFEIGQHGITGLKVREYGIYMVYSQVAVNGRQNTSSMPNECAHQTVLDRSGVTSVLLKSLLTQYLLGQPYYEYQNSEIRALDTKVHLGIFQLYPNDIIRVNITNACDHYNYSLKPAYAYFGLHKIGV